jgi:YegS/Rv2252/BmrU family lipid kinase
VLIYNPVARRAPKVERLREAAARVEGWEITLQPTDAAGHATALAANAASEGYDVVVACGGDGTVNEVANGLVGSSTAMAVVRGGTANVWAKEVSIPKDASKALRLLAEGETRSIDLGRAGERYFVLMAGVGFDAAIVRDIGPVAKRRLGAAAFIVSGLRKTFGHRSVDVDLELDHKSLTGSMYWMLASNSRSYGGVLNIAASAKIDDGLLDVYLLRRGGLLRLLWLLPWILLGRHHRQPNVVHRTAEAVDVSTAGLPVQIDGEYAGETPLRFEVAPQALRVIVPRGLKSPLFSSHP